AGWAGVREMGRALRGRSFDTAILFPNSYRSALVASRADIPERWGYRTDWRRHLLTRMAPRPSGVHQIEYYQQLVRALGFPNGGDEPHLCVSDDLRAKGGELLRHAGWDGRADIVALAPGAAYGGAKRWPPASWGDLVQALAA